jgi:UDP-glucuronate decarboxylase
MMKATGARKLCFLTITRQLSLEIKVARIFNTYGPRMHRADGRVVSNFVVQALQRQPITLYGDGTQTRSFCYVDDLIDGLIRLMDAPASFTGPVNLGNPTEFTMRELADLVIAETKSSSKVMMQPLQRKPVISLARKHLDWFPRIDLANGLIPTVEVFYRSIGRC